MTILAAPCSSWLALEFTVQRPPESQITNLGEPCSSWNGTRGRDLGRLSAPDQPETRPEHPTDSASGL